MKKQSSFGIIVTILVFLVIGAFWWSIGQVNPNVQANNTASTPIVVTAAKIESDYTNNEISADDQYKGQYIQVSGFLSSISKGITGSPYIVIGTNSQDVGSIECSFSDSDDAALATLSAGNPITVEGIGNGYVMINDCSIVSGSTTMQ